MDTTLLVSIIVAVTAVGTLLFREIQRRRDNLDKKVKVAVEARIGSQLKDILDLETSARKSFQTEVDRGAVQLATVVKRGEEVVQ